MKLHREGYPTLLITGAILALLTVLAVAVTQSAAALWVMLPIALAVEGFFAWFFRNPPRQTPQAAGVVISPADGTIVAVERVTETEYFKDERLKISIYMSPLNVHLNRAPLTGTVRYVKYHPGKYLMAFHPKSSELNERNTVVIAADGKEILVRQIAGFLARRIVSYFQAGQAVTAGQELGFIKFGSRCDVFLPPDAVVQVALQQRVRGGETPIARI